MTKTAKATTSARSTGVFLVKSEPFVYAFDQLLRDKRTAWEGVRNYEARNNLRAMKKGDLLLFYHSNEGKEIVGLARVAKEAYPDPTSDQDWSVVDVEPIKKLVKPVTLAAVKAHPTLSTMALVRRSRISVVPVTQEELRILLALAETTL
jgi:predicted RNA-binding protein with PUA-like domain